MSHSPWTATEISTLGKNSRLSLTEWPPRADLTAEEVAQASELRQERRRVRDRNVRANRSEERIANYRKENQRKERDGE